MDRIYLNEVNINDAESIIKFIVSHSKAQVVNAIREKTGINTSRYTNMQIVNLLLKWFNAKYNISQFLDVPVYATIVRPVKPSGTNAKNPEQTTGDGLGSSTTETTEDSNGSTWSDILGGILSVVTIFGQIFLPSGSNTTHPAPPPVQPSPFSGISLWIANNTPLLIFMIVATIGGIIVYKNRKKWFGEKAA